MIAGQARPRLEALVFDFDGVIVDSESPFLASWTEVYASHGVPFPLASWYARLAGDPLAFDPMRVLTECAGIGVRANEVESRRWRRYCELLGFQAVQPGVLGLLANARSAGVRLAIASGAERERLTATLERLGLPSYFDTIVCGDDVARCKPFPDVYVRALESLEVPADCAIAIEDSRTGILAAKAAGLTCIAVPNHITSHVSLQVADRVYPSLEGLDIATLDLLLRVSASPAPLRPTA